MREIKDIYLIILRREGKIIHQDNLRKNCYMIIINDTYGTFSHVILNPETDTIFPIYSRTPIFDYGRY